MAVSHALLFLPQYVPVPFTAASGGSAPTYVNGGGDYTGGGSYTTAWSLTAGNHLTVMTVANDTSTTNTCSATGNTFVYDGAATIGTLSMRLAHIKTIAASGTLAITCTGTTPIVAAQEYSGGTGDLDTTSSGTNPSFAKVTTSVTTLSPTAFTPADAATFLTDNYGDLTGSTITLTQVDTNFTTTSSALTGATAFVGANGRRVVASAASYSDGFNMSAGSNAKIVGLAAYK